MRARSGNSPQNCSFFNADWVFGTHTYGGVLDLVLLIQFLTWRLRFRLLPKISGTRRGVPDTSEAPGRLYHSYLRRGLLPQRWRHYFARNASGDGKLDLSAGDQIHCDRAGFIMRDSQEINHVGTNRKDRIVY
jgi:hypothetical protein